MSSPTKESPTILVTGSSGLIGSSLVIALNKLGYGHIVPCSRSGHDALAAELNTPVENWDILSSTAPVIDGGIDLIVHCATANDLVSSNFNLGMDLTLKGTKSVLDYAVKNQIKNVFFLSTIQVYGTNLSGEISLKSPLLCETQYALNHYFGEELCRMYYHQHGLRITIIRPTNVYGDPGVSTVDRSTLVPTCFIKEALLHKSIRLRSSGMQYRNFVSTEEVAHGMIELIQSMDAYTGVRIVNIASNFNLSIRAVAEYVANAYQEISGKSLKVVYESKEPRVSNEFSVKNDSNINRSTKDQSERVFKETVLSLFKRNMVC